MLGLLTFSTFDDPVHVKSSGHWVRNIWVVSRVKASSLDPLNNNNSNNNNNLILAFLAFNPGDLYYMGYKSLLNFNNNNNNNNGLSLVSWEAGKPLTWDVTVICPLADSYVAAAAREAGSAAEEEATRKTAKYSNIQAHHIFQPVAVEALGPVNASGRVFLSKLGRKLADQSGDDKESSFQRLSVLIQRYNAILLHDCFVKEEE